MRRLVLAAVGALLLCGVGAAAPVAPNDPAWPDEWAQRKVRLPEVWELTTGDPGIVIATIDTGVNRIPDLEGAIVPGWDFVENDAESQDTQGHGTQVASVIAARGNNGIGIAGHCWQCRIMPVRVSAGGAVDSGRIATGINWAVEHGARIVDISLTHTGSNGAEEQAVKNAIDRGVIVIASAGNNGNDVRQYPAAYPGVLSVGATDDADSLYFWSSRGPWVALAAPGCQLVLDITSPAGTLCGTSFTPAAVAGVAGLILSRNPSLTHYQVVAALTATAQPVPGVAFGRVDAYAAFESLGLVPKPPAGGIAQPPSTAVRPPGALKTAKPGQLFSRQARFVTGSFRRGFHTSFKVGRGRFEMQLLTVLAKDCSLSLRSADEVIVAARAVKNLLSLSLQVTAGRYTAAVGCRGVRTRQFTLGVIAMFPRAAP